MVDDGPRGGVEACVGAATRSDIFVDPGLDASVWRRNEGCGACIVGFIALVITVVVVTLVIVVLTTVVDGKVVIFDIVLAILVVDDEILSRNGGPSVLLLTPDAAQGWTVG
jgi:hypothetical protein